jgi:acetylornithine aminotransferase/acetylornithine/N-succinyldiaminopimelate aminotransferase
VQCGHFRTGRFHSFQRILESVAGAEGFLPDGVSMAKSLGGGFPIGAFWLRDPLGELLGPGTHGTTYGGNPLGCSVALRIMEIIERDQLADHARRMGEHLQTGLRHMQEEWPQLIAGVRGLGLMIGVELMPEVPGLKVEGKPPASVFTAKAMELGLLVVPAGSQVFRLLPALNLTPAEAEEGVGILRQLFETLA